LLDIPDFTYPAMNYNRIKSVLVEKGRTSNELAKYLDRSRQAVSTWCRNANQPEMATLFKIAEFLGVEPGELLTLRKDLRAGRGKGSAKKLSENFGNGVG
jgi:putative transcriptional regulator